MNKYFIQGFEKKAFIRTATGAAKSFGNYLSNAGMKMVSKKPNKIKNFIGNTVQRSGNFIKKNPGFVAGVTTAGMAGAGLYGINKMFGN